VPDIVVAASTVTLTFLLAGMVKGVIGMGLPTVAMGLLSLLMAPVQAAALLVDRHPDLQVDIIGDGPLRDELAAQISRLGLVDRVHLLGLATTSEVAAAMAATRAVVLPCRIDVDGDRDGMPTVLVESLARGVPVVSTDVVGIGELVTDGETGLLVGPEDVSGLAGALDRLLVDPDLAARLGAAGRWLVRDRFRPQDSTAALVKVFAAARQPANSTAATSTSTSTSATSATSGPATPTPTSATARPATARPATARPATGGGTLS